MATGTVLWFDPARGFGFVRPHYGPRDAFVHASAVVGDRGVALAPGTEVEFELVQTGDGRVIARAVTPRESRGRRRNDPPAGA
ncbi:MAG: cold-shock protein [Thermaurantiacus tibetensis]|uniref:cold-shock protein n=1 Tax=Thermaurantiacus tibetensis TaxID=2759035 RepID=UPI00188F7D3D|nr:cold shock domain-containing protein [Thermaurantiacus tibetensis]